MGSLQTKNVYNSGFLRTFWQKTASMAMNSFGGKRLLSLYPAESMPDPTGTTLIFFLNTDVSSIFGNFKKLLKISITSFSAMI